MIGTKELLSLVEEKKLVENLCSRELENPEGAGFDLRLKEVHRIKDGEAFLGENDRKTPETELLAVHLRDQKNKCHHILKDVVCDRHLFLGCSGIKTLKLRLHHK